VGTYADSPDLAPLPGVTYPMGTMSLVDIYPTHAGIGGIATQDRALPAYAQAIAARQARVSNATDLEGLVGSPAGYFALLILALLALLWWQR